MRCILRHVDVVNIELKESVILIISAVIFISAQNFRNTGVSFCRMAFSAMLVTPPDIFRLDLGFLINPGLAALICDRGVFSSWRHSGWIFLNIEHSGFDLVVVDRTDSVAAHLDLSLTQIVIPCIKGADFIGRRNIRENRKVMNSTLRLPALVLVVIDSEVILYILSRMDAVSVFIDDHLHDLDCDRLSLALVLISEDKVHSAIASVIGEFPVVINDRAFRPVFMVFAVVMARHVSV